jgi:DNA-binding NtrC family response regulator
MSLVLKRKGYEVSIANDGFEAIDTVKEEFFDIIFMDIKMPVLNGVETYKKIKEINEKIIIIMMTAYAVEDLIQDALKEGAYGVIYKPLDFEKILSLIEESKDTKQGGLILIVDDDPGTCKTLENILTKKGYDVVISNTGEDAITKAKEKFFDIIFIDMKLPTLNGLETYLELKKINPKLIAIVITAYHQEMHDLVQEAMNNSAYTCLTKPINIEDMLVLINEILTKK